MTSALSLEDFESATQHAPQAGSPALTDRDIEATEQTAYERGYAAGWDDAVKAEQDAQAHISAEMARNLQDLGFTFHEARTHVMRAIEPFLAELLTKFLPQLAHGAVPAMVHDVLMPLVEAQSDAPVDLSVPVGAAETVGPYLSAANAAPVRVVEEPSLTDGQAILRSGVIETRIDLAEAIAKIAQACEDLYSQTTRSKSDGQARERSANAR